jgi:hypothetical protein
MNGDGQSDRFVVPANPPNKAAAAVAGEERERAKGNTGSETRPGRSAGLSVSSGLDRVRQVAVRDKGARFTALLHHVTLERLLLAYQDISPKAAPGADGVTWDAYGQDLVANLRDLHERVQQGRYRASPSRRAYIPKADGRLRPLGIATLEDKIVQRAVVEVLNAVYEADFRGFSYGFRPGRGPHQALDALVAGITTRRVNWVLDADIRDFLDAWSHCSFADCGGLEQPVLGGWHLDTQAFPASGAGQDGAQLAALDLLQYGLAGDAERLGGVGEGDPALGGGVGEHAAEVAGEADLPGRAWGDLLAGDEAVVQPAQQGRRCDVELAGSGGHVEQFSFRCLAVVAGLVAGDFPVVAE